MIKQEESRLTILTQMTTTVYKIRIMLHWIHKNYPFLARFKTFEEKKTLKVWMNSNLEENWNVVFLKITIIVDDL